MRCNFAKLLSAGLLAVAVVGLLLVGSDLAVGNPPGLVEELPAGTPASPAEPEAIVLPELKSTDAPETNSVGRQVSDFSLPDASGKMRRLDEFSDARLVVVAFVGTECPLVRLYTPRLEQLAADYRAQGVQLVAIDANVQDTPAELADFAQQLKVKFPLLIDADGKVADLFGAKRTPEVFVLDRERVVRYHGRIDDQFQVGAQKPRVGRRDLAIALDELLAGKGVSEPALVVSGCLIGRERKAEPVGEVTWTGQIAGIMSNRCVECHRSGEIAPFSLVDYDDAVAWGETIVEAVDAGRMPPWFASESAHVKYANENRLTDEEKHLIAQWVADGAPHGPGEAIARVPERVAELSGEELIIPMSEEPFHVPADGVVDYQYYTVDPGWTEDRWVSHVDVRPGNRGVVHHVLVFVVRPGAIYPPVYPGELIGGYVPGLRGIHYPQSMAMRLPAGSKIVFQMHYTPNGTPCDDTTSIALRLVNESEVTHEVKAEKAINVLFQIPPNDPDYKAEATYTFVKDATLLSLIPHMHVRGKSIRYDFYYPDGSRETLLNVPRYDFNWQLEYILDEPKQIPAGTKLICRAKYDNSAGNKSNPDPTHWVTFGEQTWQEMLIGFFIIAEDRNQTISPAEALADRMDHARSLVFDLSQPAPWTKKVIRIAEEADKQIRYAQRRGRLQNRPILGDLGGMVRSGVVEAEKQKVLGSGTGGEEIVDVNRSMPFLRRMAKALEATMDEGGGGSK
ncbi:MAG: redoxin domain-containing protein [Pirellulales bacterium]|nr:redoxin domain-containing protein [Pirellulales bacterium]